VSRRFHYTNPHISLAQNTKTKDLPPPFEKVTFLKSASSAGSKIGNYFLSSNFCNAWRDAEALDKKRENINPLLRLPNPPVFSLKY